MKEKRSLEKWKAENKVADEAATSWTPADFNLVAKDPVLKEEIEYGKDLIAHTAKYSGPKGSAQPITNGMNCQNCHMDAGTKAWGNNYGAVFSTYLKYSERSEMEAGIF